VAVVSIGVTELSTVLGSYNGADRARIDAAALWAASLHAGQKRVSGEPYITHPVAVASILADLRLDSTAIVAALLHDVVEDTVTTLAQVQERFGAEVALLVDGVTKIAHVGPSQARHAQSAETIRKILFAMVKDIRVILIKLADKLHNMRTLGYLEKDKARETAEECLEIYAPLAGRMGIFSIKDELEDLALKVLNPRAFEQIKRFVAERKGERDGALDKLMHEVQEAAAREGIEVRVKTRAKHFYSIYQKMKKRNVPLDEIYDLLGIRLLCRTPAECYSLLGLVHQRWRPIAGRFKDYIAMPKSNRYQSLHTVVMGTDGRLMEFQIRTFEMDETAEYGVAAHWLYKRGGEAKPQDLAIINKLRAWDPSVSANFLDEIKGELLKDSIYVFTPRGDVVELPSGATPIDFAYYIHTEVGHRVQGARVDGRIWPLKKPLKSTQLVEVITSPNGRPRLSWLTQCKTHRARTKIRQWLNQHDPDYTAEKEPAARPEPETPPAPTPAPTAATPIPGGLEVLDRSRVGIRIGAQGERNILVSMAGCCAPAPGDMIVGYVSRGRGIVVHRKDCRNIPFIRDFEARSVDVDWETTSALATRRFLVTAREAPNVFSEIEGAIRKFQGHLISGKLTRTAGGKLTGSFTVEIADQEKYRKVIKSLRTIPSIINIQAGG
jgi:GTP diphosphokinase / guanosine-3',5'-bis(diphosphate) 3'-diphosphatase